MQSSVDRDWQQLKSRASKGAEAVALQVSWEGAREPTQLEGDRENPPNRLDAVGIAGRGHADN